MRRIILVLTILSCYMQGWAQEATPLSLQQSIDYALKHNYSAKNAELDVLIQKAQNDQVASAAYPHVSLSSSFTNAINPQYQFADGAIFGQKGIQAFSFMLPYSLDNSLTLNQLLFDGSVFVALRARQTVLELARQRGEVTKETIRYNVTKAYYALVISQYNFDIVKSSLLFARSLERDLRISYQTGVIEKIDAERSSVQANNLASDSIRLANTLVVSEQMLKNIMNMPINAPIVLTDTDLLAEKDKIVGLLNEEKDYTKVPVYNLAMTSVRTYEYNVKCYKADALPTLGFYLMNGTNYASDKLNEVFTPNNYNYPYFIGGVQLKLNIFQGFYRTANLREAKLNVQKAQNDVEDTKRYIDFQVEQSQTTLRNALLQSESSRRNLEVANDVLRLAQIKYKGGVGSNSEVSTAQTDQLRAQNVYFIALLDVVNAAADLKRALGLLK